eukprot:TRINITY_DN58010_c3_g1_i1.p1 TRINITY_DN58010_c3_g1~~TRINITY_DN58010_c3_g1_i1.p1  ORF type:complete len:183 (-),score=29.84 TRINITY_DN58010_c3_g1_i1:59-550(-)
MTPGNLWITAFGAVLLECVCGSLASLPEKARIENDFDKNGGLSGDGNYSLPEFPTAFNTPHTTSQTVQTEFSTGVPKSMLAGVLAVGIIGCCGLVLFLYVKCCMTGYRLRQDGRATFSISNGLSSSRTSRVVVRRNSVSDEQDDHNYAGEEDGQRRNHSFDYH